MIAQRYTVANRAANSHVGSPILRDNNDTEVRGFVEAVTERELTVCLFQSTNVPDDVVVRVLDTHLSRDAVMLKLTALLTQDEDLRAAWIGLAN